MDLYFNSRVQNIVAVSAAWNIYSLDLASSWVPAMFVAFISHRLLLSPFVSFCHFFFLFLCQCLFLEDLLGKRIYLLLGPDVSVQLVRQKIVLVLQRLVYTDLYLYVGGERCAMLLFSGVFRLSCFIIYCPFLGGKKKKPFLKLKTVKCVHLKTKPNSILVFLTIWGLRHFTFVCKFCL